MGWYAYRRRMPTPNNTHLAEIELVMLNDPFGDEDRGMQDLERGEGNELDVVDVAGEDLGAVAKPSPPGGLNDQPN